MEYCILLVRKKIAVAMPRYDRNGSNHDIPPMFSAHKFPEKRATTSGTSPDKNPNQRLLLIRKPKLLLAIYTK